MRTFFLITNTSGLKYWSYLGHADNTVGTDRDAVKQHGIIFINQHGGYFTPNCVRTVHATVIQEDFPKRIP